MSTTKTQSEIIERRAHLLAELFLQDLDVNPVPNGTDSGCDFLVAIPNRDGGTNFAAVQVKATAKLVGRTFPMDRKDWQRLITSNLPTLLLVVDAKHNCLYHAFPHDLGAIAPSKQKIAIPVQPADDAAQKQIRERLSGATPTRSTSN